MWCRCASLLFLPVLLLTSNLAVARDRDSLPTPFGQKFYLAAESTPKVLPVLQSAPEAEQWRARIQAREWATGPYGSDLSETLTEAANYFLSRGDYRTAIAHWRRAVHLTRVNDGLYSPLQLPLLERLLQTYLDTYDYESADEVQAYLYYLYQQQYQPGSPELTDAMLDYMSWQREQWLRNPDVTDLKPLFRIWKTLNRQQDEEVVGELDNEQRQAITYAQLEMLYVIGVTDFGMDREAEMLFGRQYGSEQGDINIEKSQLQMVQQSAYSRGRRRLEELEESLGEGADPMQRADLFRRLGDWHLWNDQARRAGEAYRKSWDLLDGADGLRLDWYGAAQELPVDGLLFPGPAQGGDFLQTVLVDASFAVTARGKLEDIETRARDPERQAVASRVTRWLRRARFRPRIEDGEMVASGPITREYRVN